MNTEREQAGTRAAFMQISEVQMHIQAENRTHSNLLYLLHCRYQEAETAAAPTERLVSYIE